MKNEIRCLFLFSVITAFSLFAQIYQPESPLVFEKGSIIKSTMSQKIKSERASFTSLDIDELKVKIKRNNIAVESQISILKNKTTNVLMDKQELLKLVDIKKMQEQITVKQKSRKEIEQQIQQDLKNITLQGLYLVLLNDIDMWASKEDLSNQAEKLLAPIIIEDLNGIFISSLTVIENNQQLTDQIKAEISGEMTVEKQYISKAIGNRTKFLYLIKANVAPLKKSIAATQKYAEGSSTHLVINLLDDNHYKTKLQDAGVPSNEIANIEFEVTSGKSVIDASNSTSSRRQQQIIRNGFSNMAKIDEEIETLKANLSNRSSLLKQTIESKTSVLYNINDMEGSINKALKYFDNEVDRLKKQLIEAKENELVAKYSVNVTSEGNPAEDIAKTAYDLSMQIKQSYSKVEQFIHETNVVNNMLVSDKTGSGQDIYRDVEKIWLYPVAGNNDNFILTVVAKFGISAMKQSDATIGKSSIDSYPDMVLVEGGTFMMGSNDPDDAKYTGEGPRDIKYNPYDDERPYHKVYVKDFYIDRYEVTNAKFCKFLNAEGNQIEKGHYYTWLNIKSDHCKIVKQGNKFVPVSGYDNHPVVMVNWFGASAYAKWAGKRLPTEAEWEYAARGGKKSKEYLFSGSNDAGSVAWYHLNSGGKTHSVGTKQPNQLGVYDMSGNVWEWCADWYDKNYYKKSPYENPTGPAMYVGNNKIRVVRGGSYESEPRGIRCSSRGGWTLQLTSYHYLGFRCAR